MKKKSNKRKKKNKKKAGNKNEIEKEIIKSISLFLNLKINNTEEKSFNYYNEEKIIDLKGSTKTSIFCCENKINKVIFFRNNQIEIEDELETLFRARKSKNNYFELIYPLIKMNYRDNRGIEKLDNRLWYVCRSHNQNNKYENKNEEYNLL